MNQEKIDFLKWLINRIQYKYGCDPNDKIIQNLQDIIGALQPKKFVMNISDSDLDKIIAKYFVDFTLDKCQDMNLGFTDKERLKLRADIKNLVSDIINKNVPKDFLIKG